MADPIRNPKIPINDPPKRPRPAVPTPDWDLENLKAKAKGKAKPKATTPTKKVPSPRTDVARKKKAVKRPHNMISLPSTSSYSGPTVKAVPQKPGRVGTTAMSLHHFSTPIYQNPHVAMVATAPATPAVTNVVLNSIKIQNCVATVNTGCSLDLLDVYCKTRFSEYNPQKFQGVIMKLLEPRATALIFKSGKIVCTGAKNEYDAYMAARKFVRIIEKVGFPSQFLDFKVQNFCATADLRFPVRLDALQYDHGQFASYEPELFPGLVYRMVRPGVVLLIFVNGKVVFTGGKTRHEITEALEIIYPVLRGYRIS